MSLNFEHPIAVKIRKSVVQCLAEFDLIEEGDRVMVCCSGGKDSTVLLATLSEIVKRAPYKFTIHPVILDQKQPGFQVAEFKKFVKVELGLELTVLERDTYSIVIEKSGENTYCALCSRLRRGILYGFAHANGFNKMALGHHRDDLNQTLLLNLFYTGKLSAMPPKLLSDDGRNILIRPLANVNEADLSELSKVWGFPVIPCNLCGSQEGMKRKRIKKLIDDLSKEIPNISASMLNAQKNIRVSQMSDSKVWNFDLLKIGKDIEQVSGSQAEDNWLQ